MENVLNLRMKENDAYAETIRDYLEALLRALWQEGESFSGKRPFGNSGWEYDLYQPLIAAGLVGGEVDGNGDINECDTDAAYDLIDKAIVYMCSEKKS